jgi:hypothetical protein
MLVMFWLASFLFHREADSKKAAVYDFSDLLIYDAFNDSFLTIFQEDRTYTGNRKEETVYVDLTESVSVFY